jgi:exosortase/archaeosortase family protein
MKSDISSFLDIAVRYSILIIIGLLSNVIFYVLFTSLTVYSVYFLLELFFDTSLVSNIIIINKLPIEIIGSCIAGSAYFLLLILNLSTRGITLKKRIGMLLFSFLSLLLINILRITLLSIMFVSGQPSFDITHRLFWYLGSTLFVIGIWFLSIKIFKIKEVPFYSDIKFLLDKTSRKKVHKSKSSKKH